MLTTVGKLVVVIAIAFAFLLGLTGTVYLSLKSPEVKVPEIVGKDMAAAEDILDHAGLNLRKRTSRYSPNAQPNTVLDQIPKAGEIVKEGQTIAVVVARAPLEGEVQAALPAGANGSTNSNSSNDNAGSTEGSENENRGARNRNKNSANSNNANSANRNSNSNKNANGNSNNRNLSNRPANSNGATNRNTAANANTRNPNNSGNRNVPTLDIRRPPKPAPSPGTHTNN